MIRFDKEEHTYYLDDKKLISVTQLIKKHNLDGNFYENVDEETLKKKAERGTIVHEEIDDYIKNNNIGFTKELKDFIDFQEKEELSCLESEMIVNNDIVAGTIDLMGIKNANAFIADHKTTCQINYESVSWQLSIYAYLFDKSVYEEIDLYIFWYKDGVKLLRVLKKPIEEIEKLLDCERKGKIYKQEITLARQELLLTQIKSFENFISELKEQEKNAQQEYDKVKEKLKEEMQKNGVKSLTLDNVKITLKDSYIKESVDSKELKKQEPLIYEKYKKESRVKESILITIQKEK